MVGGASETIRQKLSLNAADRLKVLETFSAEVAMGAIPDSEALEVCIGQTAPHLTGQDRLECVKDMEPHPLLSKVPNDDKWDWSQEQIGNVFLALEGLWTVQIADKQYEFPAGSYVLIPRGTLTGRGTSRVGR